MPEVTKEEVINSLLRLVEDIRVGDAMYQQTSIERHYGQYNDNGILKSVPYNVYTVSITYVRKD